MNDSNESRIDEIIAAFLQSREAGETISTERLFDENPEYAGELRKFFSKYEQMAGAVEPMISKRSPDRIPPMLREFGDYQLLTPIAQGGMGIVYKARQKSLNRVIALKMIRSGAMASDADVQRFRCEAESAAKLKHPHIVTVYEVGEHLGQLYFTMPYITGGNLAAMVSTKQPLTPERAVRYVIEASEAIDYAHDQGILHRDLKPANILVDASDQVQVTDYGLATQVDSDSELTRTGQIIGTPSYMSPEQASGQKDLVGPGSDVYSLGAVLFELLTGGPPFRAATSVETVRQVIEDNPPSPRILNPAVPRDLETICLKCLEKSPARRYVSAGELAEELRRFQRGQPIRARRISHWEQSWRWCRRHPMIAGLSASVALLLLTISIGGAILTFQLNSALQQSEHDREQAVDDRNAAQEAERKAKQSQLDALVAEAHASRYSGRTGQRFGTLGAIQKAVALTKTLNSPPHVSSQLRNLAISALALPDVKPAEKQMSLKGIPGALSSVAVDPSFQFVAERLASGEVSVRRLTPIAGVGAEVCRIPKWPGHESYFGWSPQGKFLVRGDWKLKQSQLWRIQPGNPILVLEDEKATASGFSSNGSHYLSLGGNQCRVYDLETGKPLHSHPVVTLFRQSIATSWIEAPCHPWLPQAAIVKPRGVTIVNYLTGKQLAQFSTPENPRVVDWHPDGELLAVGFETKVLLYNILTGKQVQSISHQGTGLKMAFNQKGTLLATRSWAASEGVKFWDPYTGDLVFQMDNDGRLSQPVFSPTDEFLARWDQNWGTATSPLTQVESGAEYRSLAVGDQSRPTFRLHNVTQHPNHRLLAVGTSASSVRLIDLKTGKLLAVLPTSSWYPRFDDDGSLVIPTSQGVWRWAVEESANGPAHLTIRPR
ncbi:MAG: protein kinase, partial [Planctomycetaceae bacterium]|nr:protein kinase [Planctomycetaceae bacterium]